MADKYFGQDIQRLLDEREAEEQAQAQLEFEEKGGKGEREFEKYYSGKYITDPSEIERYLRKHISQDQARKDFPGAGYRDFRDASREARKPLELLNLEALDRVKKHNIGIPYESENIFGEPIDTFNRPGKPPVMSEEDKRKRLDKHNLIMDIENREWLRNRENRGHDFNRPPNKTGHDLYKVLNNLDMTALERIKKYNVTDLPYEEINTLGQPVSNTFAQPNIYPDAPSLLRETEEKSTLTDQNEERFRMIRELLKGTK